MGRLRQTAQYGLWPRIWAKQRFSSGLRLGPWRVAARVFVEGRRAGPLGDRSAEVCIDPGAWGPLFCT